MSNADRPPSLLKPADAAAFLGVAAGTLSVWRCVHRYDLPYLKIGRKVMYSESDLLAFLASRRIRGEFGVAQPRNTRREV